MEAPRGHLAADEGEQYRQEDRRAEQIAQVQRHAQRVAAGLAQRRGEDLDDPEAERDGGNLAGQAIRVETHAVTRANERNPEAAS